MNNFEYLIAGLPVLTHDYAYPEGKGFQDVIDELKPQLSESDAKKLDFLLEGFNQDNLDADFYGRALRQGGFLKEYFSFDLNMRNAKVRYLNSALGRPLGKDVVIPLSDNGEIYDAETYVLGEFDEEQGVSEILNSKDILARERGIDDCYWTKIDDLTVYSYFSMDALLGFIAKLHIVDRWSILDPEEGKARFRRLVEEIRGTFGKVEYTGR